MVETKARIDSKFGSVPHIWIIYTLLAGSFLLHSFTLTRDVFWLAQHSNDQVSFKRSRRQADVGRETTPNPEDYSGANVEFIHPKLREEMDLEDEDPNNPWVWLTSYSRIPVSVAQLRLKYELY